MFCRPRCLEMHIQPNQLFVFANIPVEIGRNSDFTIVVTVPVGDWVLLTLPE